MKALVLCAGLGTRLRPITDSIPKPMIEVGGEPLLHRILRALERAGVTDVAINLHHLPDVIRNDIGSTFGEMNIHYSYEEELLGSAGAIRGFPGFFDDMFFVVYGDVYFEVDLEALREFHLAHNSVLTIATYSIDDPTGKGVVTYDPATARVTQFVEKPLQAPPGSSVNSGIYVCEPRVAALVPPRNSDFGRDLIPLLVAIDEPVYAFSSSAIVLDIGTMEGLERARRISGS
ncbi:MAG: nucleotidyltransferase family protein [Actinomycetota bacterium]